MSTRSVSGLSYTKRKSSVMLKSNCVVFTFDSTTMDVMDVTLMNQSGNWITIFFKNGDKLELYFNSEKECMSAWIDLNAAKRWVPPTALTKLKAFLDKPIAGFNKLLLLGVKL